jgi:hypothetical protein
MENEVPNPFFNSEYYDSTKLAGNHGIILFDNNSACFEANRPPGIHGEAVEGKLSERIKTRPSAWSQSH